MSCVCACVLVCGLRDRNSACDVERQSLSRRTETVHSGTDPRWLRPVRSAEQVPLWRYSHSCVGFPLFLSH